MIVIVDYNMGNLGSIKNMLKKIGSTCQITSDREAIKAADKIILPGVGSFDNGMQSLKALDLIDLLNNRVLIEKKPVLGICLGMQLLMESSEEGKMPGLGWIRGECVRFSFDTKESKLKIPHMGWNTLKVVNSETILKNLELDARFYFVHSYHVVCLEEIDVLARTHHGYDFVSALQKGNILGMQFHPEKSHRFGMALLKEFVGFKHSA